MNSNGVTILLRSRLLRCALLLAVAVLAATPAFAAPLPASTTAFAVGEPDPVGGSVIAGGVPVPFVAATFSGTLTSTVIAGDMSNPYGGLTFTYLLTNNAVSPHEMDRLTINDYFGFLVNASYQTPAAGVVPTLNDRDVTGNVVGFTFLGGPIGSGTLLPGSNSALLVLQTDAPYYQLTQAAVIDGSVAMVSSFAPSLNVPEPSTLVLGATGLGLLGWYGRRRRQQSR